MFNQEDPKAPSKFETIGMAVAIATLSALTTGLVHWGLHELQQKFGSKPEEEEKKDDSP